MCAAPKGSPSTTESTASTATTRTRRLPPAPPRSAGDTASIRTATLATCSAGGGRGRRRVRHRRRRARARGATTASSRLRRPSEYRPTPSDTNDPTTLTTPTRSIRRSRPTRKADPAPAVAGAREGCARCGCSSPARGSAAGGLSGGIAIRFVRVQGGRSSGPEDEKDRGALPSYGTACVSWSTNPSRPLLDELGRRVRIQTRFYLVGGASPSSKGGRGATSTVDFAARAGHARAVRGVARPEDQARPELRARIASPLRSRLPGWRDRSVWIRTAGKLQVYHYDFTSQLLAKIERGHSQDLTDVQHMLDEDRVDPAVAMALFERVEPDLVRYPAIDPVAYRAKVERSSDRVWGAPSDPHPTRATWRGPDRSWARGPLVGGAHGERSARSHRRASTASSGDRSPLPPPRRSPNTRCSCCSRPRERTHTRRSTRTGGGW